jgi:hypothetical protein
MIAARSVIDTLHPLWGNRSQSDFNRLVGDCAKWVEALPPKQMKIEDSKTRRGPGSDSRLHSPLARGSG